MVKKYIPVGLLAFVGIMLVASTQENTIDPFSRIMPIREGGLLYLGQKELTDQEYLEGIERVKNPDVVNVIVLANNKLTTINKSYFERFKNLTHLNLSGNHITTIDDEAFEDLPLVEINLSHNRLPHIQKKAFDDCKDLADLNLSYNAIKQINKEAFDDCKKLERLNLAENPIAEKEVVMHALRKKLPKKNAILLDKPA